MVTLTIPRDDDMRYLFWSNSCFGPWTELKYDGEPIHFDSSLSALVEEKGIFHENNVEHDKIDGDLYYHPILKYATPSPTDLLPRRVTFPIYDYNGKELGAYANYGLAVPMTSSIRFTSSQVFQVAWELDPDDPTAWFMWEVTAFRSNPTVVTNYVRNRIQFLTPNSGDSRYVPYVRRIFSTGSSGIITGSNWNVQQSYGTITSLQHFGWRESNSSTLGWLYKARVPSEAFSISSAKNQIDTLVASIFPKGFPLKDKHYGELAMEASSKVNANTVNMIAFLKDLRKPWEMVPKLKSLRALKAKNLSEDYLSTNYGLLPTISDVKSIVAAFKRVSPYLDRNGFTVYTAVHSEEKEVDSMFYSLEQRIKLAIDDEDDEFQALIQRLESMGTLPTFENLWDLVPYSFVVDWFIDVGGFLERVDSRLRLARLNIRYATMSRKQEVTGIMPADAGASFVGTVHWVQYHRWVSDQCPVPPLSLEPTFQDFDHWLESGALIAQRTK